MNLFNKALTDAFCDEEVDVATCACGATYAASEGEKVKVGHFAGAMLVRDCNCDPVNHVANTLWRVRHQAAKFYANVAHEMAEDRKRLFKVMPKEIGE